MMFSQTMKRAMRVANTRTLMNQSRMMTFSSSSKADEGKEQKIDFGFTTVDYEDKEKLVGGVFSNVAEQYDVMNDAMSLGVHRIWKNEFVDSIGNLRMRRVKEGDSFKDTPMRVLDVAGGTGDISFRILEKAKQDNPGSK